MEDKRVYLVTKHDNNSSELIGIFTNQKKVIEGISKVIKLTDLYIIGVRKNKQITPINLNIEFQKPNRVDLYDVNTNQIKIQIGQYGLNHINPKLVNN